MQSRKEVWHKIGEFLQSLPVFWILVGISILAVLYEFGLRQADDKDGYSLNVYTEFLGLAATVLIVNTWYQHRDERRRKQELKERLLSDAISPQTNIAQKAFYDMRVGRLIFGEDSILRRANLYQAIPGKVILRNANMERAFMWSADFSGSIFTDATLKEANLMGAKLANTEFGTASLRNVNLENADLSGANLIGADLTGANLLNADLNHVHSYMHWLNDPEEIEANPRFYRQLILPDGCPASENVDFSRFTDPNYPGEPWRSKDPDSPAYRGHYQERLDMMRRFSEYRPPPPHSGGGSG